MQIEDFELFVHLKEVSSFAIICKPLRPPKTSAKHPTSTWSSKTSTSCLDDAYLKKHDPFGLAMCTRKYVCLLKQILMKRTCEPELVWCCATQ